MINIFGGQGAEGKKCNAGIEKDTLCLAGMLDVEILLLLQKNLLWEYMNYTKVKDLKLAEPRKIGFTYKSMGAGFWALKQDNFRKAIQKITMEVDL